MKDLFDKYDYNRNGLIDADAMRDLIRDAGLGADDTEEDREAAIDKAENELANINPTLVRQKTTVDSIVREGKNRECFLKIIWYILSYK